MDVKASLRKFFSPFLLINLAAMIIVVIGLLIGVHYWLDSYTLHGQGYELPNLYGMDFDEASLQLEKEGLKVVANDTGYNKKMDADVILMQTPGQGTKVKAGRTIYVTINSTLSPKVRIPDIIDNSSFREAQARLSAIGFRLEEPKVIDGERDWVYGVMANGKNLQSGEMVSIETPLMLVIGNGTSEEDEDGEDMQLDIPVTGADDVDEFTPIE